MDFQSFAGVNITGNYRWQLEFKIFIESEIKVD